MKKISKIYNNIKLKLKQITIDKLILVFLVSQPFLDIYLKVVGERWNIFGFSLTTLIRMMFITTIFICILLKNKSKKEWIMVISYLLLVGIYTLIHIDNGNSFYNSFAIGESNGIITEMLYIFRLTLPIILLYCVYKSGTNLQTTTKYIALTAFIISLIIVVTDIFKVSYIAYSLNYDMVSDNIFSWFTDGYDKYFYAELTAKGWFYEANTVGALLVLSFPIVLYNVMKSKKWYGYIGIVLQILSMIMLGSKTASYGWLLVYIGYMIFYIAFNTVKRRKYDFVFIFMGVIIILLGLVLLKFAPVTIRDKDNSSARQKYEEYINTAKKSSDGKKKKKDKNIEYKVIYKNADPRQYIYNINSGKIEVSKSYDYSKAKELLREDNTEKIREFVVNEYIAKQYKLHYIYNFYIEDAYPYKDDPEFWLGVLEMPFEVKSNSRNIEKLIVARLKEKNDNFVMDTLFGLNDSALKTRGYVVESDFYSHYYTIGIVGIVLFFGPYFVIFIYSGMKILLDYREKFTMGNVMYILSILSAICMGYLSGHLFDEYLVSFIIAYVLGSLLIHIKAKEET